MEQLEDVSDKTEESHATQEENMPFLTDGTFAGTLSTSGESEKPEVHAAKGKRKRTKEDKVEANRLGPLDVSNIYTSSALLPHGVPVAQW